MMSENGNTHKKPRKIVSGLIVLLILALGSYYYSNHTSDFHLITTLSFLELFLLLCVTILTSLFYGFQLKIITDHYDLGLNFPEYYGLSQSTTFINFFTPFGGAASFKAIYLKKIHGFPYSSFLASMGIVNIIKFLINAFLGVIFLFYFRIALLNPLILLMGSILIGTLAFLTFGHRITRLDIPFRKTIDPVLREWKGVSQDRSTIIKLVIMSLIIFTVTSLSIYFSFHAFSSDIPLITCGAIASFTIITGALNLVPGNFGIKEAIIITLANLTGVGLNDGVHAAALLRMLSLTWALLITPLFLRTLARENNVQSDV